MGISGVAGFMLHGLEPGGGLDTDASSCSEVSGDCDAVATSCLVNHLRWPDGDYGTGTGVDWEPGMLLFLRVHPLQ